MPHRPFEDDAARRRVWARGYLAGIGEPSGFEALAGSDDPDWRNGLADGFEDAAAVSGPERADLIRQAREWAA